MLLTNFYNQNPKATTKIIIQMLSILFLADIVWIALFSSAWEHNTESDNSNQMKEKLYFGIHYGLYIKLFMFWLI